MAKATHPDRSSTLSIHPLTQPNHPLNHPNPTKTTKTQVAKATHPDRSVYDGNIDAFETNMKAERLAEIFSELKKDLVPLLQRIMASPLYTHPIPKALEGGEQWDVEAQAKLSREISEALGFDYELGRIDTSVHPFTGGSHPTDVRITTRYSTEKWMEGISGTVHEVRVSHVWVGGWVGGWASQLCTPPLLLFLSSFSLLLLLIHPPTYLLSRSATGSTNRPATPSNATYPSPVP